MSITKWFQENSLSLILCKTHLIQFSSKNQNHLDIAFVHRNCFIPKINEIKFLGLHISNTLFWTTHIDNIFPKLSSAGYAMRLEYVSQLAVVSIQKIQNLIRKLPHEIL
jgi:hypothetical protein